MMVAKAIENAGEAVRGWLSRVRAAVAGPPAVAVTTPRDAEAPYFAPGPRERFIRLHELVDADLSAELDQYGLLLELRAAAGGDWRWYEVPLERLSFEEADNEEGRAVLRLSAESALFRAVHDLQLGRAVLTNAWRQEITTFRQAQDVEAGVLRLRADLEIYV